MIPLYLVDGFNFLHAVLLVGRDRARWWSPENQARVVEAVAARAAAGACGTPFDIWVVFDQRGAGAEPGSRGSTPAPDVGGRIEVHQAPDADDYIVARCAELAGHRDAIVVSADRSLRDRAKNHGARGLSPWAFASYVADPGAIGGSSAGGTGR